MAQNPTGSIVSVGTVWMFLPWRIVKFLIHNKTGTGRSVLNEKYQKAFLVMILILISEAANYYSHFILHSELLFSHIFYIPIVLACFWWIKRGIWVSVFLAASYITFNVLSSVNTALSFVLLRSAMFIVAGITVAILRENRHCVLKETCMLCVIISSI